MGIEEIRKANKNLIVRDTADPALAAYGKLHAPEPYATLVEKADRLTGIDPEANRYVASAPELENDPAIDLFGPAFGFVEIQIGYCNGPNSKLNGLEWHKSPEIDIAVTDLVLLLGKRTDIGADGLYDSRKLECFYLPRGAVLELSPEVLHYSPCKVVPGGFKSIIVLPRGTNGTLTSVKSDISRDDDAFGDIEPRLLFMRNKWLVAHPDRTILVERGAFPGIRGENIEVMI